MIIMLNLFKFKVDKVFWVQRAFDLLQFCTVLRQHVCCDTDTRGACDGKPCRVLGRSLWRRG